MMDDKFWMIFNGVMSGLWIVAWIMTLIGSIKFNLFLLGSIFSLWGFIIFYKKVKNKKQGDGND